jgi:predicted DNA-binding transcriptional regulator YafY
MSKRESLNRYILVINRLRRHPASFNEISEMLERESEIQSCDFSISKRTFQRDCQDISSLFNIEIAYDRRINAYYITYDDNSNVSERIMEAFDTLNALKISDKFSDFMHFETRRSKGTENMYDLVKAIQGRVVVCFTYELFNEPLSFDRTIEPYALKEFRNRWYLLGKDCSNGNIRTYGLDRISALSLTKATFKYPIDFSLDAYFKDCFGIFIPKELSPEEIILSFNPERGRYIKSMPLHHSQKIMNEQEDELLVSLHLCITPDFLSEILSYGSDVKVLHPQSFMNLIAESYKKAISNYSDIE